MLEQVDLLLAEYPSQDRRWPLLLSLHPRAVRGVTPCPVSGSSWVRTVTGGDSAVGNPGSRAGTTIV